MTVDDLYNQVVLHHDMNKVPVGYQSLCFSAIRETLHKNGISMEREVKVELSESVLPESKYYESVPTDTELYSTDLYESEYKF